MFWGLTFGVAADRAGALRIGISCVALFLSCDCSILIYASSPFFSANSISRVNRRSERRTYMRAAYALFNGDSTEGDLAKQMELAPGNVNASGAPYFYANLYLGLYAEAKGDAVLARKCEQRRMALKNMS